MKTFWVSSLLPNPVFCFANFNYGNFWKFFITTIFKGNSEWPVLTITFPNNLRNIRSEVFSERFRERDNSGDLGCPPIKVLKKKVNFRCKGFWWPSNQNKENAVINTGLVRLFFPYWPKVGRGLPNSRYNEKKQTFVMLSGSWPWMMLVGTELNLLKKEKSWQKSFFR